MISLQEEGYLTVPLEMMIGSVLVVTVSIARRRRRRRPLDPEEEEEG